MQIEEDLTKADERRFFSMPVLIVIVIGGLISFFIVLASIVVAVHRIRDQCYEQHFWRNCPLLGNFSDSNFCSFFC
jgi:hypothetical protein